MSVCVALGGGMARSERKRMRMRARLGMAGAKEGRADE